MSYSDYAAQPGVNWSRLKLARTSMLHYRDTPPRPDTGSLGMLRAVHALVLEPEHFDRDFAVFSGATRRGKAWDEFKAQHEGKTILNDRELGEARGIAAAVYAYPPAAKMLSSDNARTEVGLQWTDKSTGLPCKGRADLVIIEGGRATVIDLKTVRTINRREVAKDAARMGYHGQLAHYAAGVADCFGVEVVAWGLLCVEGSAPHDVGLFLLDGDARAAGTELRDDLLRQVAEAERSGHYPGQCPTPQTLILPDWA